MNLISVLVAAEKYDLTTLAAVKQALGKITPDDDIHLEALIRQASDMVVDYTSRMFAREVITEKLGVDVAASFSGFGSVVPTRLMLSRIPILMVQEIRYDGVPIDLADPEGNPLVQIEDSEAGFLFREAGWTPTRLEAQGIEPIRTRVDEPLWEVDYSAGYVLPSFTDVSRDFAPGDIDVNTNTITITDHGLVIGDVVRFGTAGTLPAPLVVSHDYFVRDTASGSFKVAAKRGGSAVNLTDIGVGTSTVRRQRTLPYSLEYDVIQAVVALFKQVGRDPNITSERLGDYQVTYSKPNAGVLAGGLPPAVEARLERYRMMA